MKVKRFGTGSWSLVNMKYPRLSIPAQYSVLKVHKGRYTIKIPWSQVEIMTRNATNLIIIDVAFTTSIPQVEWRKLSCYLWDPRLQYTWLVMHITCYRIQSEFTTLAETHYIGKLIMHLKCHRYLYSQSIKVRNAFAINLDCQIWSLY